MASYKARVVEFETCFVLTCEAETEKLGARIAAGLRPGDLIALSGGLGTGKTTLARAILRSLGITGEVPSPTFTLVQRYESTLLAVHHFDLYRLGSATELAELGLDEALERGAALVEWPENGLPNRLLEDALTVSMSLGDNGVRTARIQGSARWSPVLGRVAS